MVLDAVSGSIDRGGPGMISVVIAEDQELVRTGLRMILDAQDDITVVADVADGDAAVHEVRHHRPEVALLDVQMPGAVGLQAALTILADPANTTRVIMLTTFDLDEHLYATLHAGASGFLLKSAPRAHLLHAIRTATNGDALMDPTLIRRLIETHVHQRGVASAHHHRAVSTLNPRERDVLIELARGRSNSEIANRLFLAETTVKSHVSEALRKLELRDRAQAVVFGYECGLIRPGDNPL